MYVHHSFPVILAHLENQIVANDSGIIHQNLQLAKLGRSLIHGLLNHLSIRYIALTDQRLGTKRTKRRGCLLTATGIEISQRDSCSFFSQAQGSRGSNTPTSACDKSNSSVKSSHTFLSRDSIPFRLFRWL